MHALGFTSEPEHALVDVLGRVGETAVAEVEAAEVLDRGGLDVDGEGEVGSGGAQLVAVAGDEEELFGLGQAFLRRDVRGGGGAVEGEGVGFGAEGGEGGGGEGPKAVLGGGPVEVVFC